MTRKRGAWLIGGAVVLVAAFIGLTVVPVTTQAGLTTRPALHAESSADEQGCAGLDFTATFGYSVTRPLVDLWGFAAVSDVTVDDATITVVAGDDCTGNLQRLTGHVAVLHPDCGGQPGSIVSGDITTTQPACDGKGVVYTAAGDPLATEVTINFEGAEELPGTGLARREWCLDEWVEIDRDYGSVRQHDGGVVTQGDLCLDLS